MNNITDKIEDVQNTPDKRHLDIDKVGIKSIRHPISVKDKTVNTPKPLLNVKA